MKSQMVNVHSRTGLHLRAAALFCKKATAFQSKVTFRYKNVLADAKSILSILGACVGWEEEIQLICDGPDEEEAMTALVHLFETEMPE